MIRSVYQVTAVNGSGAESGPSAVANATMAKTNLIVNPGFELDANGDGRPDSWTSSTRFTRQAASARSGGFGGRHNATNNAGYTIGQTIAGLSAATTYDFAGWVNIPATTDAFTFRFNIVWRNASNGVISTQTVTPTPPPPTPLVGPTGGWVKVAGSYQAPPGTTNAQINMVVTSLNATINVDDIAFR